MPQPVVSILVPIYNVQKFLPQCLDSLIGQTLRDIEIICIDDGSTDSSPAIIERYAAQDARIRVITKQNTGYGDSMNQGIEAATGEFVGICEPDDYADRRMFASYAKALRKYDCDLVKSEYWEHFDEDGSDVVTDYLADMPKKQPFEPRCNTQAVRLRPAIWSALYRRSMLMDNGIRFTPSPGASFQDTGFVQKCWVCARKAVFIRKAYLHYRMDNAASSSKSTAKVFAVCGEYESTFAFLRQRGAGEFQAFAPALNAMRNDGYAWNYNRIAPECHLEFVQRWSDELAAAQKQGVLDLSLHNQHDADQIRQIMADPAGFCQSHPEGMDYL